MDTLVMVWLIGFVVWLVAISNWLEWLMPSKGSGAFFGMFVASLFLAALWPGTAVFAAMLAFSMAADWFTELRRDAKKYRELGRNAPDRSPEPGEEAT